MKASEYIQIKGKAHGLREIYAQGRNGVFEADLWRLDRNVEKALRFEKLANVMFITTAILMAFTIFLIIVIAVIAQTIGVPIAQEQFGGIFQIIFTTVFCIIIAILVTLIVARVGHNKMMKCSPAAERYVERVNILLDQEKLNKERANLIMAQTDPYTACGLGESLIALLAGDIVDAEESRETEWNVNVARGRFHRTYEALKEIGVPLEKKRTYFPVKAK